jgi:hypothetical protein
MRSLAILTLSPIFYFCQCHDNFLYVIPHPVRPLTKSQVVLHGRCPSLLSHLEQNWIEPTSYSEALHYETS